MRGLADCRLACGIYWGSRTEGPPTESSTAFQPAPSPASVSCTEEKQVVKSTRTVEQRTEEQSHKKKWVGVVTEV